MTHFPGRTALILLAGTALSGCVSPNFPIDAPAGPAPRPVAAAPAPQPPPAQVAARPLDPPPHAAPPVAEVESRPLAPIAAAPSRPAAAAEPPAVAVAQVDRAPETRTVTTRSVTGRVVDVEGEPQTYTVRRGDTLSAIADRMGTTIRDLARDNDLDPPYNIRPGQTIRGPRQPAKAYVIGEGDTLFAIARRFGVSADAIAEANDMSLNDVIVAGRRLRLPEGYRDRGPLVSTSEVPVEPSRASAPPPAAEGPPPEVVEGERRPAPPPRSNAPPAAEERTVTTRSVTGRVVDISVPGRAYKVKRGDNLEGIARELDSSVTELARINNLRAPYRIQPGQTIRGPGSSAKAYVVERGDTLSEVAQRFGVAEAQLRSANGLRRGASLAPGRRLRLPAGYRDRGPIVSTTTAPVEAPRPAAETPRAPAERPVAPPPRPTAPAPRPTAPTPTAPPSSERLPDRPQPYRPPPGGVVGAPVATPPPSDSQIAQMGRGRFIWPLQGEVISGFGGRGTGPRNDGLNIRAQAGEPVRAAADGEVVYAGDQVPGFGNLVLVKHADGWVTAYGHLGRLDVRMQERVVQGQQIGQAGSTGGVSEPQLHFEVRFAPGPQERARPVDPNLVMPR